VDQNTRRLLSAALQQISVDDAELVQDPSTFIEVYHTDFLTRYQIYSVQSGYFPLPFFYVGFAPHQPAYELTAQPKNFIALARADHVKINSLDEAASYAYVYLEVTRVVNHLFYPVTSLEQVRFRAPLKGEELKRKTAFEQKYRSLIAPPASSSTPQGYRVTIYAVREQALELHTLHVQSDGDISDQVTVLEERLPLLYGL
jgi:hypothetical protein